MKNNSALRFLPKKILVPLDLTQASLAAWDQAQDLARRFGAKVELAFGKAAEKIVTAAEDADLIVLVARSKGFWSDAVLGTVVERVLRHSDKPILTLPSSIPAKIRVAPAQRHENKSGAAR